MLLGLPIIAAVTLYAQAQDSPSPRRPAPDPASPVSSVAATRAAQPPVIDGRDDDAVWRNTPAITDFQAWRPTEGWPPTPPTQRLWRRGGGGGAPPPPPRPKRNPRRRVTSSAFPPPPCAPPPQ